MIKKYPNLGVIPLLRGVAQVLLGRGVLLTSLNIFKFTHPFLYTSPPIHTSPSRVLLSRGEGDSSQEEKSTPLYFDKLSTKKRGRIWGFSLVEIMVVTSIITIGFTAVLGLIRKAIIVYYNNQNYLAAATVAQQGLELTRYIRDDNWLVGSDFSTNISQADQGDIKTIFAIDQQAMVDSDLVNFGNQGREKIIQFYNSDDGDKLPDLLGGPDTGDLSSYVKDSRAKIYFDTDDTLGHNFYIASSTLAVITNRYTPTIFHNLIQTTYRDNGTPDDKEDDYLYVISMVYWQDRGADKYFTLATYLYDYSWKY